MGHPADYRASQNYDNATTMAMIRMTLWLDREAGTPSNSKAVEILSRSSSRVDRQVVSSSTLVRLVITVEDTEKWTVRCYCILGCCALCCITIHLLNNISLTGATVQRE